MTKLTKHDCDGDIEYRRGLKSGEDEQGMFYMMMGKCSCGKRVAELFRQAEIVEVEV